MASKIKKNQSKSELPENEDNKLPSMRPPKDYSHYQIGSPADGTSVRLDDSIFDLGKLNGFNLLDDRDGILSKEYTVVNRYEKTSKNFAIALGAKTKFSVGMAKVEAGASTSLAWGSVVATSSEKIFMLCKYDGAWVKLKWSPANIPDIIASLKPTVAEEYWKIINATTEVEKYKAWKTFTKNYGTGCVLQLDLISYSVAQIDCVLREQSKAAKGEHQLTFGVGTITGSGFSASVEGMHSYANSVNEYDIKTFSETNPAGSTTKAWVDELSKEALKRMEKKEWDKVKDPEVVPLKPKLPEYPKVDPKKSDEESADTLSSDFEKLEKSKKDYKGLEMYNLAQKEVLYATKAAVSKKITKANEHVKKSIEHINEVDIKKKVEGIEIDDTTVKLNDFSIPFLFVKELMAQKISNVKFEEDEYEFFILEYTSYLTKFPDETSINNFVRSLVGDTEKKNVYMYANTVHQYAKDINLNETQKKTAEMLYNKTKQATPKELSEDGASDLPVTEEQYLNALLETQMKQDCIICKDVEEYKLKLKEIEANFYTKKIIEDILKIELS